ncbi:mercuric reductase [Hymenobacter sp. GOD-10R]|uniref:mercuric reductase n=1 Tax=Hymenobacter sp. GOD-10R TaxID=3093922 RepID=UPI002D777CB2|nr:mercuric reductase [Hymenobacter sp. GOD-10R]WRQ27604.1 mercuric reductase [Hymenobacter sp. GOD-10R]
MPTSYDVLIIGSGQAGNPLAVSFAKAGRKVVLVEEKFFGGSCINYGCTPTKALLASAERAHQVRTAEAYGIGAEEPKVDFAAVMARKNHIVEEMREGTVKNLTEEQPNITVLHGHAEFTGPHSLRVTLDDAKTQEIEAELIFINTGTHAAAPNIEGLLDVPYLTPTQMLDNPELPEHLLILGGSYIGLEFGQIFRRLGSKVTIIESNPKVLSREDDDVCDAMQQLLADEGVEFVLGVEARRVSQNAEGVLTLTVDTEEGERRLRGTHLLVATGREPNTNKLGLDKAGVELDEDGYIKVNDDLLTNVPGVYALGDVHGGPQFTHISYDDYRVVRDAILHDKPRSAKKRPLPYVVFTQPQLGRVGLSEKQAQEDKIPYRVASLPVSTIGRARETGHTAGFIKVLVDEDNHILGTAVLSEQGGEIMTMLQLAMTGNLTCNVLQGMVIAHPTWAEALNNLFTKLVQPEEA